MSNLLEQVLSPAVGPNTRGAILSFGSTPWSAIDKRFFEVNPHRSAYIRRIVEGELPSSFSGGGGALGATHVAVLQVQPGARSKVWFSDGNCGADIARLPDFDSLAMLIAQAVKNGKPFAFGPIVAHARALESFKGELQ